MIPTGLVYTQALLMLPDLLAENRTILEAVCRAASVALAARLRSNLTPEDCREDFVMAASMYAVAAMSEITDVGQLEQVTAGDLTLRKANGSLAANCLRMQADMLMAPYVKTSVAFMGV
jgi:hypothetical protein